MIPSSAVRSALGAVLALAIVSVAGVARADKAAAEALFQEGRRLMDAKSFAEACPKLAESHRLDPGIGVLLYLGDCYLGAGKTASAWAAYREAEPAARAAGQADRERVAREKIAALEPKLSKIVLVPPGGLDPTSYEVRLDRAVFGAATLGVPVPVDPGAHEIVLSAPGRVPWQSKIEIRADAPLTRVELPTLAPAPDAAGGAATPLPTNEPSAPPNDEGSSWSGQKTAALVVGGIGVGGVILGSVFGAMTFSTWSDAEQGCSEGGEPRRCSAESVDLASEASTQGTVSTVAFVAGGACLAGAVVLWLTAPDGASAPTEAGDLELVPSAERALAGGTLRGAF